MRKTMTTNFVEIRAFREGVTYPTKSTSRAAGYDVYAYIPDYTSGMMIHPGQSLIVPTGLNVNIPEGYEIQVRPRSGLAAKNCITVLNSPGTIDCDFFGLEEKFELKVILINHGKMPFVINHNDRIAQLVICQLPNIEFKVVEEFSENSNDNRTGGFGSTGV
jgi:dUTP pyrophosphatase